MENLTEIKRQIELHSPEGIRECFKKGISANEPASDGLFFMNSWVSTPVRPGLKSV